MKRKKWKHLRMIKKFYSDQSTDENILEVSENKNQENDLNDNENKKDS